MICFSLKSLIAIIDDEISVKSQKTATAVLYLGNSVLCTLVYSLSSWRRQAKAELRTSTARVEEMTKLLQNVQGQMQRRVRKIQYVTSFA